MSVLAGIMTVLASIIGGYLMEAGQWRVLIQPAELIVIVGAALGTILIANPVRVLPQMGKCLQAILRGPKLTRSRYTESLRLLNDIFRFARKNGVPALETALDNPQQSGLFGKYSSFLADEQALAFLCDTLRTFVGAGGDPFDYQTMLERDTELQIVFEEEPAKALASVADALPGLGIVAAVLGIVIAMDAMGGPREQIGARVSSALVGTFLGILLCYGFLAPIASHMSARSRAERDHYQLLGVGMLAFIKGASPSTAVEYARRSIPPTLRPTFKDLESTLRGGTAS